MKTKVSSFLKRNLSLILLVSYGIFLIFYKCSGSFMADEAIYGQVAKESLWGNSFLTFHWKQQLWFEKPPLMLWLTTLSFKLFGISETSAHIFPGIFGTLSAILLYKITKELFKNELASFLAGFVFLTTPVILFYNRSLMMDIPAGFFISFCVLAVLKIRNQQTHWWLLYFLAMGLAILTKSVLGLLPIFLLPFCINLTNNLSFLKNKHFSQGIFLLLFIAVPWHLYMSKQFGLTFWNDYLGFHIWTRLKTQIFPFPWENGSNLGYVNLLFFRSGLWFWLFSFFLLTILFAFSVKKSNFLTFKLLPKINAFKTWFQTNSLAWKFLLSWLLICSLPFLLAATKLPNYIILTFFPISIFTGEFLALSFKRNFLALALGIFSLLNFFSFSQKHASDFGEAHFLLPKLLTRFLNFNAKNLELSAFIFFLVLILSYLLTRKRASHFFRKFALSFFIVMNLLIPFSPLRNEFIKELGSDISNFATNQSVKVYYKTKAEQFSFPLVLPFYLPAGSQLETISNVALPISPSNDATFYYIQKEFATTTNTADILKTYTQGFLTKCSPVNCASIISNANKAF